MASAASRGGSVGTTAAATNPDTCADDASGEAWSHAGENLRSVKISEKAVEQKEREVQK